MRTSHIVRTSHGSSWFLAQDSSEGSCCEAVQRQTPARRHKPAELLPKQIRIPIYMEQSEPDSSAGSFKAAHSQEGCHLDEELEASNQHSARESFPHCSEVTKVRTNCMSKQVCRVTLAKPIIVKLIGCCTVPMLMLWGGGRPVAA